MVSFAGRPTWVTLNKNTFFTFDYLQASKRSSRLSHSSNFCSRKLHLRNVHAGPRLALIQAELSLGETYLIWMVLVWR